MFIVFVVLYVIDKQHKSMTKTDKIVPKTDKIVPRSVFYIYVFTSKNLIVIVRKLKEKKESTVNNKITKSNSLISASYRLSLNELRILLYGLSFVNPLEEVFPLSHRFSIKELADFYGIPQKERGSFYQNIKHALVTQFWKREFTYYDEERKEMVSDRWLIEIRHGGRDGTLAYHYNPLIAKELKNLTTRFTSYFLSNVANMKSTYAIRFYEISIMYLNASKLRKTNFQISIEELKAKLGITNKYKQISDFKRRVLNRAKEEINKHSDIDFNFEIIKVGRNPINVKFTVYRKNDQAQHDHFPELAKHSVGRSHKVSPKALEKAKGLIVSAKTRWDIYAIEEQFYDFMTKKGAPSSVDGAFIGFVKKKVAKAL